MRAWVLCIVLGVGLLGGSAAWADIPQPIIQQTADFRVQQAQLKHLTAVGKLTDREAFTQANTIEAQITALWQPYRQASAQDVSSARTAITSASRWPAVCSGFPGISARKAFGEILPLSLIWSSRVSSSQRTIRPAVI